MKERNHFGDLGIGGGIILRRNLKEYNTKMALIVATVIANEDDVDILRK
jgi:hypothetical protein